MVIQVYIDYKWQSQNLNPEFKINCSFDYKYLPIYIVLSNYEVVGY